MYVSHTGAGTYGNQKRASDPLTLELQRVVSCQMGGGTQTWVPWKRQCINSKD